MIITFRSKETADIMMLDEHALKILRAIGRNYETVPEHGVITAAQLPDAIANLEHAMKEAVANNPDDYAVQDKEAERREQSGEEPVHPVNQPVGLSQRGYPVLQMLKQANKDQDDVVWETGSAW